MTGVGLRDSASGLVLKNFMGKFEAEVPRVAAVRVVPNACVIGGDLGMLSVKNEVYNR